MKPVISPRELADAIGVSESSLKRWADNGMLVASRTVGGHRKILINEAIRFIRETRTPLVRPAVLGLGDVTRLVEDLNTTGPDSQRLYKYLSTGRAEEARGLLSSLYLSGQSMAQICDGPLHEAMNRIGELWNHYPGGILLEHRATDICLQGLLQLRSLLAPPTGPVTACGAALSGDPYLLPSQAVALTLMAEGLCVTNFGPETPLELLAEAAAEPELRLLWISVSTAEDARETARRIEELSGALMARGVTVVAGGRIIDRLPFSPASSVVVTPTLAALSAFVKGWRRAAPKTSAAVE